MIHRRSRAIAGIGLVVALGGITVFARFPRVRDWAEQLMAQASAWPGDYWLAFGLGQIVVAACGILPASLMAIAAGAAFGMVKGLALSALCTMLGGWLAFLLSRSILRPWIARAIRRHGKSARFDDAVAEEGWRFVCLLRISPVMPFAATSYGLGLTRISQRAYLLGTLASLPALASYVALGAFGREGVALGSMQAEPLQWALRIVGIAVVIVAMMRVKRMLAKAARPTAA